MNVYDIMYPFTHRIGRHKMLYSKLIELESNKKYHIEIFYGTISPKYKYLVNSVYKDVKDPSRKEHKEYASYAYGSNTYHAVKETILKYLEEKKRNK